MVSRFVTNGPVKQEGICIMPPPPPHYRMMPPQRSDFHVTQQQTYVAQPPNQTGNQGQGLRGMAQTGPPTQASTPPNTDLKVQQMTQQPVNLPYLPPQPIRNTTQNYYRGPPPQNQNPRMPNHRQGQQQMYQPQSGPFLQVQPIYCTTAPVYFPNGAQRPGPVPPQYYSPAQAFATIGFSPQTAQSATPQFVNYSQFIPRPQIPTASPNLTQAHPSTIPITQTTQKHIPAKPKRKRENAIPIIDPSTGLEVMENHDQDDSHPPSGESSARQTPQPPAHIPSKEIQNTFTKQVHMVISQDKMEEVDHSLPSALDQHLDPQSIYHNLSPAVHTSRSDLVQSSKLLVPTKEFVPAIQSSTAKELTPVVSAITDAAEVTINKPKDRESPIKNRKQREQVTKEVKEVVKEPQVSQEKLNKEEHKINKEENKIKEPAVSTPNMIQSKEVKEISNQREEKKNQKKEKGDQVKVTTNSDSHDLENIPVTNPLPVSVQDNGKTKQKAKEPPKQPHQQPVPVTQKSSVSIPVPQSQPCKPNNRTSKIRDLNMKGANKQGTDMDAFSDNIVSSDTLNLNATNPTNTTTNDIVKVGDINDSNRINENNDVSTIKPEFKTLPKSKVDVTDIVKDVPKPYIAPVESQDETDRVELANDKLVQAKNEANNKANIENDSSVIDTKPSLPYKEDQWSPLNKSGKKMYDRDFLLALRNDPKSRKKPDNLYESILQEDRGRLGDISRYPMGGRTTDFAPAFGSSSFSGKSSSQRGAPPKRNSQQGKIGGSNSKTGKTNNRISFSVREDVKLHETENAWKPARFNIGGNMTDEEKKTQELYRKVRGVLNKLTPQKFDTLVSQVRTLAIDNEERLQGVIDLVFEKAVEEPNFSSAYALMCKELALMQVPVNNKKEGGEFVNFRKLLITRCQLEFEKNSVDELSTNNKIKEIEECTDPEKKKELQLLLEEEDRRIRRKSVGNIRFIGELFKQNMLTVNIMQRCLNNLLEHKDEESLECLCKLLTTVGKEVETVKGLDLTPIFSEMKDIVDKKDGKISSRVRFMLQDVIDLRNAKWVPRRQDLNPKTMDQIQKEAHDEQLIIQSMNSIPTPRKDDRGSSGPGADRKRRNVSDTEGWSTASNRGGRPCQFSVQSDKLKTKTPQLDEPLGSAHMYGRWGSGSNIKMTAPSAPSAPPTANMYALLADNIVNDTDKRPLLSSRSKEPYSSKGPSLERNYKQPFEDGRSSRSGSQHRSNDSSQRLTPTVHPLKLPKNNAPVPSKPQAAPEPMTSRQLELKLKNILEEYLSESSTAKDCSDEIRECIPSSALVQFVTESYNGVLERSKTARIRTGTLFGQLIQMKTLPLDNYCMGLKEILDQADDLTIDIPKIWDYLAEIIAPVLWENALPMNRLLESSKILVIQSHAAKLLAPLFKLVTAEKDTNHLLSIWQSSDVSLSDFMPPEKVAEFTKEHMLEFLCDESSLGQGELTYEQIHKILLTLFGKKKSFDEICKWITEYIGDKIKENKFIRTLATCIFEDSIVNLKLKTDTFKNHYKLFTRFVDGNLEYELQCLYALQAYFHKIEHPQGTLLLICNSLYEDNVFSHESFVAWESSSDPAEQEGKGVALKQLTSFFTQMKEGDDESSSASEDA